MRRGGPAGGGAKHHAHGRLHLQRRRRARGDSNGRPQDELGAAYSGRAAPGALGGERRELDPVPLWHGVLGSGLELRSRSFADIADLMLRELYEIKNVNSKMYGLVELNWHPSFLPGWGPGEMYSADPKYIGLWPGDPSRSVYAQMRVPGVIVYWDRSTPQAEPIPIYEWDLGRIREKLQQGNLKPVLVTWGTVVVVGATVIILLDPVLGDEALLPLIWAPILVP
jgi:hypothetical protein